jgi:RNA polymerase sigma factor (sigma-70 family)
MPDTPVPGVLRRLRRALGHADSSATDAQLLERFLAQRDEDAFELLVWRHERLVLGACRRILHDAQDAEDAFQATFLTLVRKGGSISRGQALASWLYQVACRIALRARAGAAARAGRERQGLDLSGIPAAADESAERRELGPLLDEEISRLPEKYRAPVVLCYLEGRTYDEAARRLGCPLGTLATRLGHARERLRARLARRGMGLGAGALAAALCERAATAAVPGALVSATVKAAANVAAGRAAAGVIAPQVAAMMEGALRAMLMTKLKIAAAFLLLVVLLGGGATLLTPGVPAARAAGEKKGPAQQGKAAPTTDKERFQGTWVAVSLNGNNQEAPADLVRAIQITFTGDRLTLKSPSESYEKAAYAIDPTQAPKTIDLVLQRAYRGIYEFTGDRLRLCIIDNQHPRPADFQPGEKRLVFVLKRVKGGDAKPAEKPAPSARAEPKTDKERLQGSWQVVSMNVRNKEGAPEETRANRIIFAGDKMTRKRPDGPDEVITYTLDPTQKPKAIDFGAGISGALGIYEFKGDTLRLCMERDADKQPRPADFKPGEGRIVLVLKRAKDTGPGKKPDAGARAEAPKTDKERFQGTWVGVSINVKGEEAPAEQVPALRLTFTGDRMKTHRPLQDAEEVAYRIDPTQRPKTIDFLPSRGAGRGIYEFEGDTLRLCVADEDEPRPADFKPGDRRIVIVLKRAGVPTKAEKEAELNLQVKALREALAKLRDSNAFLKAELLKRTEESERRKDEIGGVLTKVDVGNNTVSLTLGRTKLALNGVPLSVRAKFFLGLKECTINDLKPGMEVTLRLENSGERSEVVRIEASPAGKE